MQLPVFSWPHESEGLTGCSKGCWFLQASLLAAKAFGSLGPRLTTHQFAHTQTQTQDQPNAL